MAKAKTSPKGRKKAKRVVTHGNVHVQASFNNTIICITDHQGNKLLQDSAGSAGYRGSRKSTPFAAQEAATRVGTRVRDEYGMKTVNIYVKGPGPGRDAAAKSLPALGFKVAEMDDVTGFPFNGCRPPKKRRV